MAEIVDFGLQQHKIKMDSRYFENVLSVVAGDTGRRLEVQLLDTNGMVQNTTGLSLRLNAVIAGKTTYTDATLVDATTGKYQLDLSNGMFLAPGNWQFQWLITDSAGKKLHSFAFTGNIGKNISEGGSQATNFYLNLEDLKKMQDDLVNGTIDLSILETNIAEKLTDLETQYSPKLTEVTAQLAQTVDNIAELKKYNIKPQYVEFFGSFNRFGLGTPVGLENYAGGNYVLMVSGSAGDSFVTVQSGNITDAGTTTKWACVVENNDGLFDVNQVTGTNGENIVNLHSPLKANITNKRLGNLHDQVLGQHYTELGYFAFAQHIYFTNPRHAERNEYIAQMKPDDISGKWESNAYNIYNQVANMKDVDNTFFKIGNKHYMLSAANNTSYTQWEQRLDGSRGYLEVYVGLNKGTVLAEFFTDGVLSESRILSKPANRLIFNYEGAQNAKIKFTLQGPFEGGNQALYIGLTTWWNNERFQEGSLIKENDKVVFIGDSWDVNQNRATTREIKRLMGQNGGTPTVLSYSKGGHSSTYARAWFDEYVINNKPNVVIIEYFTNDFNSIRSGTDIGTFVKPDGTLQNMSISSLAQYLDNMNYMINKAIENGIQPIVVMPASTNSETQTQTFANYSTEIFLGKSIAVENPTFKDATVERVLTSLIESVGTTAVNSNILKLLSKEVGSSARKGVVSDSSVAITSGNLHTFKNNDVDKAAIRHDGTVLTPYLGLTPQTTTVTPNANNRGVVYLINGAGTNNIDALSVVIKLADGTFVTKKIQLID